MPRYLSSKISPHRVDAYFRLHPKFSYDDIEARQPSWCPRLSRNMLNNDRLRKGRRPFSARCWTSTCSYPSKVDVEFVESLSMLQIMLNTGWVVTPRGIHNPKNSNRLYPLDHFLHGERWHTPSVEVAEALADSHRLQVLAAAHGKPHWRELPGELLPREWFKRTRAAKARKGFTDGVVEQNSALTGGPRAIKRTLTTVKLDAEESAESDFPSSKRSCSAPMRNAKHQTKVKTASSKRKRVLEDLNDENVTKDDEEEGRASLRSLKRVCARANATDGEAETLDVGYKRFRVSKSAQEQRETVLSGRLTRSGNLGNSDDAGRLVKIERARLTDHDPVPKGNIMPSAGELLPGDRPHRISFEHTMHSRRSSEPDKLSYGVGSQELPQKIPSRNQYANLYADALTKAAQPYYRDGNQNVAQVEAPFVASQHNLNGGRDKPVRSRLGYGNGYEGPKAGPPNEQRNHCVGGSHESFGHSYNRDSQPASSPNKSPCGARDSLSSHSQTRGVADFDPHLLDPRPRGLTSSYLQQQSLGLPYPPSRISSPLAMKPSGFEIMHHNNENAQLAHFDSGAPGYQDLAADDLNERPSGPSDIASYLPLQPAGDSPQEQSLNAASQPSQLGYPVRTIASNPLSRSALPSLEDDFFNQFVHPYDLYEGEAIPANFDSNIWRLSDD
ncbi:MAG: hypothetical protein Q9187_001768 [Circinaria calcarea]